MGRRLFFWILFATFAALLLLWIRDATIYFYGWGFRFDNDPWLELSVGSRTPYRDFDWELELEDGDGLPGNLIKIPFSKTSGLSLRWWSARWHQEHYGE